ncbi:MAG: universal stress protein [Haloferacaceae archaeon]
MAFDRLAGAWFDPFAPPSDAAPAVGDRIDGEYVLAPLLTDAVPTLTDQIEVATALARASDAALRVTTPMGGPERTTSTPERAVSGCGNAEADAGSESDLLKWALDRASRAAPRARGGLTYGRRIVTDVARTVETGDVTTVVLPGDSPGGILRDGVSERIAAHAGCDAVVVNGQSGLGPVPSILLPIAGGPHSGLAADVAARVAANNGAWIDVLHVLEEDAGEERRRRAEACVEAATDRTDRPETTSTWVLDADDPTEAIVEQSRYYALTVVGAPTKGRLRRLVHGSTNESVRSNAQSVVLSVHNNSGEPSLSDD